MLLHNQLTRFRDATDGTSNVMMVAEQSGLVGGQDIRSGYYGGYTGTTFSDPVSASNPNDADSWNCGLSAVQYSINSPTGCGVILSVGSEYDSQFVSYGRDPWIAHRWLGALRFSKRRLY